MAITAVESKPELVKYDLAERIGQGGMATVYRATDRRLGREVAVKLIHPHLRGNAEVAARFVSEGRAVAMLRHPNIVEVYDISDETEPERYLVVELVSGPTLRELIARHEALPPEIAGAVGLQLAAALAHAHARNIVHRDVKPENVLVKLPVIESGPESTREKTHGCVKLTDFGIAKLLDAHGVTSTGQVLGSPAHMAPEQIEGGDVGPRSDVFGLGVLLYECMVGRLPFDGKNPAQVLRRVLEGSHPSADRERPTVGAAWTAVLDRALARDPADRYESIDAFARAIRAELDRVGMDSESELDAFLTDPQSYQHDFSDRIVARLGEAAERARAESDLLGAVGLFNRALAYKPGEPALIKRVSALARRARWRKTGRMVLFSAAGAGAAGAAVALWLSFRPATAEEPPAGPVAAPHPKTKPKPPVLSGGPVPSSDTPAATRTAPDPADRRTEKPPAGARRPLPVLRQPKPPEPKPPETRQVRVMVEGGARGGDVFIDRERKPNWLTEKSYELLAGTHVFQFVLNDPTCCNSPPVTVNLEPGSDPVTVTLSVTFRDARLVLDGPPGKLFCPSLFSGTVAVPGQRVVPMRDASVSESCNYSPDSNSSRVWSDQITLQAGQTTHMSVP